MANAEEETGAQGVRGGVLRRLFAYAKPHWRLAAFCLALVLLVTALELLRPILIGRAIDDYIEGYDRRYAYVDPASAPIQYDGLSLSKDYDPAGAETFALMLYDGTDYYLVRDLTGEQAEALEALSPDDLVNLALPAEGGLKVPAGEGVYSALRLDRAALDVLRSTDRAGLGRIALLYTLVLLLSFACNLLRQWFLEKIGQDVIFSIRQEVFEHLHSLSARFFDTNPVGRLVTRVTNDVESLHMMYTHVLIALFSNSVLILGYAVVMASINLHLALICFAFLPLIFGLTYWFRRLARRVYRVVRTKLSDLNSFLSENISGMKLIQVFAREREKDGEFRARTEDLYRSQMRELYIMAVFRPGIFFVANLALALIVWRSGVSVLDATLTLGTMYVFTNYIRSFFEPIQELAEQFSTLQNALASGEKIFSVLDEENPIREPRRPKHLGRVRGRIEFRHVWFAYDGEDYVLKDISFVIKPGQRVAFVGATGAGKSSILNLIGRYYDIQKGQILLDGVDIRQLSTREIRRAVGQVQQDVFLFTGDIQSNIRLLDDAITDEQVRAAAVAVNADRFIERLPKGYDEPVMERGSTLSAGQRQLLSFARTLAYDPRILVMDEATANIDTETEQLIQSALETLMQGRTTILVAHRLSTVQHADKIIVLHKGRIRESGTHQQLLERDGIYKKLYELQQ